MSKNIENEKRKKSVVMKVLIGLKDYLTDWKNLLGHALLGVGLLVIAIWAPVPIWSKLVFFAVLVTFNVWRMSRKKKNCKRRYHRICRCS